MENLYILPFDHRGSFMKIIGAESPPTEEDLATAREYKGMIYQAFKKSIAAGVDKSVAGILTDEWLGLNVLREAKADGFITATPYEKSGQDEFDFDHENWKEKVDELDTTYVKVLVRYNPEGDKEMNVRQGKRLAELSDFLKDKKSKFLFELLVPATDEQLEKAGSQEAYETDMRVDLMIEAVNELYAAGVTPDIWKIEGLDTTEKMQKVGDAVKAGNSEAGIIILGRGESSEKAAHWLSVGAKVDNAVGFAVGRTIFKEALADFAAGKSTKDEAIQKISDNYSSFVKVWEDSV